MTLPLVGIFKCFDCGILSYHRVTDLHQRIKPTGRNHFRIALYNHFRIAAGLFDSFSCDPDKRIFCCSCFCMPLEAQPGPPEGLFGVGVFGTQNADVTPEDPMGRHSQLAKGELYGLPARWGRVVFGKVEDG